MCTIDVHLQSIWMVPKYAMHPILVLTMYGKFLMYAI